MIERARAKGVYAAFRHEDIATTLGGADRPPSDPAASAGRWAAIVAADSLCYFGALDSVFAGLFAALRPGGVCAFSLEELSDPVEDDAPAAAAGADWNAGSLGRRLHRADRVKDLATAVGFELRALRREILRRDGGLEVGGLIVVLARPL
jgi:predicted TPR repeat methyltransferase